MGMDAKILALNVLALLLLNERQIVLDRKFADLDIICTQQPSFAQSVLQASTKAHGPIHFA
jgi:hypothetical protein